MTRRPLRVAFVSTVFPYPPDNGKKVVLLGFLKFLLEELGSDAITYVHVGNAPTLERCPVKLLTIPLDPGWRRLASAAWHSALLRRKSLQESLLFTQRLRDRLLACISEIDPDVVIMDTLRIGQFFTDIAAREPRRRWVLYMEDLFSRRYDMFLDALRRGLSLGDPLGQFSQAVPPMLRPIARLPPVQSFLFQTERRLVARREIELARAMRNICLVNRDEARQIAAHAPATLVWETPPWLPSPVSGRSQAAYRSNLFLIMGALNYPPNAVAVEEFLEVAMPLVAAKLPKARIQIIGRAPSARLTQLVSAWGGRCELLGFVDDLSSLLNSATAMLLPMRLGSGPKLKALEALAHGLPLVTTRNGILAIPAVDQVHCLISDDLRRFPDLMLQIMDAELNTRLSVHALELFRENYSLDAARKRYAAAFLGCGNSGRISAPASNHE